MSEKPRVRFAPSPTGFLHIGGARAALYNWLYARHTGGTFILRVEDTDRERHSEEAIGAITEGLKWLGLDWDEGPLFQSERLERYQEVAKQLEESGLAYRTAKGSEEKGEALVFRVPSEKDKITFDDGILGEIAWQDEVIEDFVLMRSSGWPTYNFSCVIDDHDMEITDVIRGLDHVSNTPRQIMVYRALGWEPPRFAHFPMINNSAGKKFSKRDGAVAVGDYEKKGYLPEAMVNFLALLGWSPGGDQEIMTRAEMVEKFTLDRVRKTPSQFDLEKFDWMNGKYIDAMPDAEEAEKVKPFLKKANLDPAAGGDDAWLARLCGLMVERVRTLAQFPERCSYFFTDKFEINEKAGKVLAKAGAPDALAQALKALEPIEDWTAAGLEPVLRDAAKALGVGLGKIAQPVRAAVTGTAVTPGLFEILELLGKERALARIKRALG